MEKNQPSSWEKGEEWLQFKGFEELIRRLAARNMQTGSYFSAKLQAYQDSYDV